jgi:starch synthase
MSVLFVASEIYPLVKTGGLADVAGALPAALQRLGVDVRLMMPAYPEAVEQVVDRRIGRDMGDPFGVGDVRLIEARMPDTGLPVYLVDCPALYEREGGPYQRRAGDEWPDNHARFALLSQVAARTANPLEGGDWVPQLLHVNDWQTGLVPAYLHFYGIHGVRTVYTIHNLRYQGLYDRSILPVIALPARAFAVDGVEFHGAVSYMKAGLYYSDIITTVSRTYAREIQTAEFGYGIEGLLRQRASDLYGIVNGIDYGIWNPLTDPHIIRRYSAASLGDKLYNKWQLQKEMGLQLDANVPLIGFVGRLTEQKGVDLIVDCLQGMLGLGAQVVLLGTGEPRYEHLLRSAAERDPRIAVRITYNEPLAHRLIAGCDMFLMPSRFEPCGLTQMYALRYGTLPIVRRTGGLADTVTDAGAPAGDGFLFDAARPDAFLEAIERAAISYSRRDEWRALQRSAMSKDFSWERSAREYIGLYERLGVDAS